MNSEMNDHGSSSQDHIHNKSTTTRTTPTACDRQFSQSHITGTDDTGQRAAASCLARAYRPRRPIQSLLRVTRPEVRAWQLIEQEVHLDANRMRGNPPTQL
jgi:hypothetical protein